MHLRVPVKQHIYLCRRLPRTPSIDDSGQFACGAYPAQMTPPTMKPPLSRQMGSIIVWNRRLGLIVPRLGEELGVGGARSEAKMLWREKKKKDRAKGRRQSRPDL